MNAGAGAGVSEDAGGLSGGVCGEDEGNKGICPFAGETGSGEMTFVAGFQKVEAPQRLQKRITPSLVAQMSASMPVSSIFSSVLQELQARESKPSSRSNRLTGGNSRPQKLTFGSTNATP